MRSFKASAPPPQEKNPSQILLFKRTAKPVRSKKAVSTAPPKRVKLQDSVPYPASKCRPDAIETLVSPPDGPFGRRPVWNNRFVLTETFPETGVFVVESCYAKGRCVDDRPRFAKQTIWFSRAGIDALTAAGWAIEQ
jgi:hypothetical protein